MKSFQIVFLNLLILFFCQCSEENQVKSTAEIQVSKNNSIDKKVDSTQIKIDQIAQRLITNSNVVKKLTEFGDTNTEKTIVIYTKFGNMKFQLYSNTPLHRSNFVMLSKLKFYDNTLFYRIIDNFMIQGGNSDNEQMGIKFSSIGRYRIPNEIKQSNIHKKGAIAMAVATEEQNFGKKSSAINFYIVEGRKMSSLYFLQKEKEEVKFTDKQKEVYKNIGGAPHLDGDYTVFGEMISGFTTLDKLSKIKVDKYSWPKKDVFIDSIRAF